MWPFHPDLLARPVPRYTSYPTANLFHAGVGASDLAHELAAIAPGTDLSLYVHIPYCTEICWYCGCNTGAATRTSRLRAYLDAVHRELAMVARRCGGRGVVRHIAFGGGSPNAIASVDFVRLVDDIMAQFPVVDPVLSVEIDPRGFTPEWARVLAAVGTTRVSLGVQTFAPHIQSAIGRVQSRESIEAAVSGLRLRGVGGINFDLMVGLPGQSEADLADTLDVAIGMEPSRIALFGYAHLPHLIPRQRRIAAHDLPDLAARFRQSALGYERLVAAGYVPVGFDHFARPDDALAIAARDGAVRRNFQGFTEDRCDRLIGIGASAISRFPGLLVQNEKHAGPYRALVGAGQLPAMRGHAIDPADRERGAVIEALLCNHAADIGAMPDVGGALGPFLARGLVACAGDRLTITDAGRPYARSIAALFDRHLGPVARAAQPIAAPAI